MRNARSPPRRKSIMSFQAWRIESGVSDRVVFKWTVPALRERNDRRALFLGVGTDGSDGTGATPGYFKFHGGLSRGPLSASRERYDRISLLLGVGAHGSQRRSHHAAPAVASCEQRERGSAGRPVPT